MIDGNEEHQTLSVAALGRRGFRVSVAGTGREGALLAQRHAYQAVVLAHKLRDAAGLEVLRILASRSPDTPVIFVVPEGSEELAIRALDSGASGYLVKTARYHELLPAAVTEQITRVQERFRLESQQKALGEAQTRFQEFMASARDPIFVIDPRGRFLAFNDAMLSFSGFTGEELLAKNLFDLLSRETQEDPARRLLEDVPDVSSDRLEFSFARKQGDHVYVEFAPHLVRREGQVVGIEILAKDVSARKRAETELKDLYGWLKAIHEATDDAILLADRDFRVVQWNQRAIELFRPSPPNLAGADAGTLIRSLIPRAREPERISADLVRYRDDPESALDGLIEFVEPERRVYWRTTSPVRNPEGYLIGRLWVFRDITARTRTEEALRESEARFERLAENAQDIIFRYRLLPDRGFEYVSPAATRVVGYAPEEHYADPDLGLKIVHPEDRHILEQAMAGPLPPGETITLRWIHKDGSVRWIEQRLVSIQDDAGRRVAIEGISRDITSRMEAEKAIRDSEERFRLIARATRDAVWDWDPETDTLVWSDSVFDLLGYSADEMQPTGSWWDSLIHPDDCPRVVQTTWNAIREGSDAWSEEYRVLRKDGSYATVLDRGFIIRDAPEQAIRMIGSVTDITERKRAEEALQESQRTLATLMSNLPGMVYRCRNDRDRTMEFVSEGVADLVGHRPEDLIGSRKVSFGSIIHPKDRERVWEEVQAAIREARPYQIQYRIQSSDGRVKWAWEQGRAVLRPDGAFEALEGFVTDVTETLKAREELERSERKFRGVFEAAAEAIVLIDRSGTVLDINPAGEVLSFRSRSELMGKNLKILLPPEELPRARAYVQALLEGTPTPDPFEVSILAPDGRRRALEVRSRVIRRPGPAPFLEMLVRDVTDQREMQQRLLQSERLASIGQLAAYVAHEINTPLTSISLLSANIARRTKNPEILAKLEKINTQRRQAAAIISDLLKFTRQRNVPPAETDLREVVSAAAEQLEPFVPNGVALHVNLPPEPVLAHVDPLQIQEVLVNLAKNGLEATAQGSVTLSLGGGDGHVTIQVEDTGTGMSPEVRARLFEPFFTTKKLGEGTGLGLSLCQSLVSAHGGTIDVESEPGRGTRFTVRLPKAGDP